MKIGILTYHFSDNIGALLQAYALREWFRRQGHEAGFVPYHPAYVEEGGKLERLADPRRLRRNGIVLYQRLAKVRRTVFGRSYSRALADFRRDTLGVTGPEAATADQLSDQGAELLVCGSDQIWNPSPQHGLDPVYFLAFRSAESARRISYAASFGRNSLAPEFHAEAAGYLRGLDAIAVRERSGVEIVAEIAGLPAVAVPDPTLLLGDFGEIVPPPAARAHLFCYALRTGQIVREVAAEVAAVLGLPILSPYNPHRRWRQIGQTVQAGPREWLGLLNDSRFAVANSFHGIAMSIVLRRPFLAVALPGGRAALGERITDLLAQLGLSDRFVATADAKQIRRLVAAPIDWPAVELRLAEMRVRGEAYLEREMQRVPVSALEEVA